jgi:hypothetical protein
METKICKKCEVEKLFCEFNKDKYSNDGFRYRCRECTSLEYKNFYYGNRKEEIQRQINYQKNNNESVKKGRNNRYQKNYDNNILYKLKINVRNRVKIFIKSVNFDVKTNNTYNLVGCTPKELKIYLEKQFTEGMSWDNHKLTGWHIDHITPLSSAKTEDDVYKLCHYTNLQPLWCNENYKKGTKIL